MKHRVFWLLVHLPGFISLIIAIIALAPSVSGLSSIQDHMSIIGKILLTLVGLLFTIAPTRVWQITSIHMAELKMKLKETTLKEREIKMARLERLNSYAETAIGAANVTFWLDYNVVKFFWCGLREVYFPYLVIQLNVPSRFLFDLSFTDIKHIKFTIALDEIDIVKEAQLVEPQIQWDKPEDARQQRLARPHIAALMQNILLFRFEIDKEVRDKLLELQKEKKEPIWKLSPSWTLNLSDSDKELNYTPSPISGKFP